MKELFFLLVVFLYVLDVSAYEIAKAPKWVVDNSAKIDAHSTTGSSNKSTAYHLVDKQLFISKKDRYQYYRYISTPLNSKGLDENGKLNITFSEAFEKVVLHHARILRNGKLINIMDEMRISEFRTESQIDLELYNGSLTLSAIIKDLRVGDRLDVGYSIVGANPILGDFFSFVHGLAWSVPVENLTIRIINSTNKAIYSKNINTTLKPEVKKTKWGVEHSISISPTNTFFQEEGVPLSVIQGPVIYFSNVGNWQEVSYWGEKLFRFNKNTQSPEWRSWVNEVSKQKNDEAKVLKALSLVQDRIRYVGIEIGENSHKPRAPSEVISNKYGDCKDKTLLLMSLLLSNGISASPVFVSSRKSGAVNLFPPSVTAFDHVIAEVNVGGKKYWLDGTASMQKGGRLSEIGYINYEYGLAVSEPNKLSSMPVNNFDKPEVNIVEKYYIRSMEAPIYLEVDATYTGIRADRQRNFFNRYSAYEIERKYLEYYSKYYSDVTKVADIIHYDSDSNNIFKTNESYLISDFIKVNEDGRYYYNIQPSELLSYLTLPKLPKRRAPFYIGEPVKLNFRIEVHYSIQNMFDYKPVKIEHEDKYRNVKINTWDIGQKSVYQYNYQSSYSSISPKDIFSHKKMIEKIKDDIDFTYTLSNFDKDIEANIGSLYEYLDENIGGFAK